MEKESDIMRNLILIILLVSGCAPTVYKRQIMGSLCSTSELVQVDNELPMIYEQFTQDAIKYWNKKAGKKILIYAGRASTKDMEKPAHMVIRRIYKTTDEQGKVGGNTHTFYGIKPSNFGPDICIKGSVITVSIPGDIIRHYKKVSEALTIETEQKTITKEYAYAILLHEIGHGIGLLHSDEKYTLMYKAYGKHSSMDLADDTLYNLNLLYGEQNASMDGNEKRQ